MTTQPVHHKDNNSKQLEEQVIFVLNRDTGKKILKFILVIFCIYICFKFLSFAKSIFPSIGISFLLAFLLAPIVDRIENLGVNRGPAIALLFLFIAGVVILVLNYFIPSISREISSISSTLQSQNSDTLINKLQIILAQQIPILDNPELANYFSTKLHDLFTSLLQKSLSMALTILSSFTMIITLPFITFFLLKDGQQLKKFLIQKVPNRYFEMSLNLIYKTNKQLGNYIRGQLMVSFVIGSLAIIALYSLNVPYFFIIGIVAGLANMIPYFGPIVGALPAVLVVIIETGSFGPVVGVIIAFAIIQLLDNILVSPLIVSKSVHIHPLAVIIVILIGSQVGGILGMLVAVPIFAVAQVLTKEIIWSFRHYRLLG